MAACYLKSCIWQYTATIPNTHWFYHYLWLGCNELDIGAQKFLIDKKREISKKKQPNPIAPVVIGIGILILPVYIGWLIATMQSAAIDNRSTAEKQAVLEATRIAQNALIPTDTVVAGHLTPTPVELKTVEEIVQSKQGNAIAANVFMGVVVYPVLGIGIFAALAFLVPAIYSDMDMIKIEM